MYKNKDNYAGNRVVVVSSMHTRGGSSSFLYFAAAARDDVGSAGQESLAECAKGWPHTTGRANVFHCNPYRDRGWTTVLVIHYYSLPPTTFTNIARDHIPTTSNSIPLPSSPASASLPTIDISTALSPITRPSFAYQLHSTNHTRHSQDE